MRKGLMRVATVAALAFAPLSAVLAADIAVTQPWARATLAPGGAGAAFMTISNAGGMADKLVKAATPVAGAAELHTHRMDGTVMRMEAVPSIEVPANGSATMAPGGLHVMLFDLKAPLSEGMSFPLTLTFEHAGDVTVTVPVLGPAAMGAGMAPGAPSMPSGMPGMGGMPGGQHPMHQGQ